MQARRKELHGLKADATTNAGLWWDKYLGEQNDQNDQNSNEGVGAKGEHIRKLNIIQRPIGYEQMFQRWDEALKADPNTMRATVKADGRTIIGIGEKGALEVGLRLHHTWGVPYLPGSALKGVASAAAHKLLKEDDWRKAVGEQPQGGYHRFLFGSTDEAGAIDFLDALWVGDNTALPIHLDVMTVHHPDYYQEGTAPSDTDSPNPISFASISGEYRVAISAQPGLWATDEQDKQDRWLNIAINILEMGLKELGVGAKTNAGYGRMSLSPIKSPLDDCRDKLKQQAVKPFEAGERQAWLEDFCKLCDDCAQLPEQELREAAIQARSKNKTLKAWEKKGGPTEPKLKACFEKYFMPGESLGAGGQAIGKKVKKKKPKRNKQKRK